VVEVGSAGLTDVIRTSSAPICRCVSPAGVGNKSGQTELALNRMRASTKALLFNYAPMRPDHVFVTGCVSFRATSVRPRITPSPRYPPVPGLPGDVA
jgi:hypothetical protein